MRSLFSEIRRDTGATFSECRRYRYKLWRTWDDTPPLNLLMLNPSTADAENNDPTVERCERRARELGYGGLVVTNLFAFRATDPREMKAAEDPVGPDNDAAILYVAQRAGMVIAAWGTHGSFRGRSAHVRQMLAGAGVTLHYLSLTKAGEPQHPLYLSYELKPVRWEP